MYYTTSDIANFLNVHRQNVHYYIKNGYLKATMIDDEYTIKKEDYYSFLDDYYNTRKRHSNRGITKKLTDEQVTLLSLIIADIQNNNISFDEFKNCNEHQNELIPQIKDFIIYKRDRCIKIDYKNRIKQKDIANTYNLKLVTIKSILNQNKRSDF